MERCLTERKWSVLACLVAILWIISNSGLVFLLVAVQHNGIETKSVMESMIVILLLFGMINWFCAAYYSLYSSRYVVNKEGITTSYLHFFRRFHSWEDVSSIVVADMDHATSDPTVYTIMIRIAFGEEKDGPLSPNPKFLLSGYEKWRNRIAPRPCKFILISYRKSRIDQIEKCSNKEIHFLLGQGIALSK